MATRDQVEHEAGKDEQKEEAAAANDTQVGEEIQEDSGDDSAREDAQMGR